MRAAAAGRGKRLAARPGSFLPCNWCCTVARKNEPGQAASRLPLPAAARFVFSRDGATPIAGKKIARAADEPARCFREGHTVSPGAEDATAARPPPPNLRKVRLGIALVCCLKVELLGSANFLPSGELLSPRCQCECPSCAEMARAAFFVARA